MDLAGAAAQLFSGPTRSFAVRLWDGTMLPPARGGGVRGALVMATERALAALLPPVSERRLAEAILEGDLQLEGDAIALLEAAALWEGPRLSAMLAPALLSAALRRSVASDRPGSLVAHLRGRLHSPGRDREAIRHHYDLSNDFYRLFLDRGMVYSCGWFPEGGESLEDGQRAKLDLVCRKLALAPGERVLDVGCGWGAFLEHAAVHYQVGGLGITLSDNQLMEARQRLARLPASARPSVSAADYRHLPAHERFHKVASIGMMEHVGRARLARYFTTIHRLLHPGGLFLNHAIADISPGLDTLPWAHRHGGGFIAHYIFPDADLVPLRMVVSAAEGAGFEVRDVESLREHYAETLAHWLGRLEDRMPQAEALVGRRWARAYRLYLASSAVAFRLGRVSVFQMLLAKRTAAGRAGGVPRARASWYGATPDALRGRASR